MRQLLHKTSSMIQHLPKRPSSLLEIWNEAISMLFNHLHLVRDIIIRAFHAKKNLCGESWIRSCEIESGLFFTSAIPNSCHLLSPVVLGYMVENIIFFTNLANGIPVIYHLLTLDPREDREHILEVKEPILTNTKT
jgi:hypothetical protein